MREETSDHRSMLDPNQIKHFLNSTIRNLSDTINTVEKIESHFQRMLTHGIDDAFIKCLDYNWDLSMVMFYIPKKYGFVLPHSSIIDAIKNIHLPVVSVGSGTGYLETLIANEGISIVATDLIPPEPSRINKYFHVDPYCPTIRMSALQALKEYPNHAVLCAFPCMDSWAYEMVCNMKEGRTLIYIGETNGGCCASNAFFDYIDDHFKITTSFGIPNWAGAHNILFIATKIKE